MTDYSDACIYRIIQIDNDDLIYIGSTNCFNRRVQSHKCKWIDEKCSKYSYPLYKYIRGNGGIDNFKFEIIFKVNCYNKYELELIERSYIEDLKPKMNKYIPTRCKKEYYKEWSKDNKERRTEYMKEYRENSDIVVCDNCGANIKKYGLTKHKKTNYCINFNKNN